MQFPPVAPGSARLGGVPLLLVRHAHAYARKEWSGEDRSRPLSDNGLRQAEGLIAVFGNFPRLARVLSSPYLRCVQTVEPLAQAHHLEVEPAEDLAEGQSSMPPSASSGRWPTTMWRCVRTGTSSPRSSSRWPTRIGLDLGPNPRQAKGSVWALDGKMASSPPPGTSPRWWRSQFEPGEAART